ncbi:MAG: hypothetical protein M3P26_07890 [Gemmatimonadota bacterium]|nr:hypothetical protein [Gemmatimonadota bacterium]
MENYNPNVDEFLKFYSQSDTSTGGTRGYDAKTYVETKLDAKLTPRIFDPKTRLVILSGNAGDGKTAFIQRVEAQAEANGAKSFTRTDNGCSFSLGGNQYQTLYDGSQDFEGVTNDAVLTGFFKNFEGDKVPSGSFTLIIAINEGKLRDFLLGNSSYKWLGKQVHHYLTLEGFEPHESLVFVNLNSRSVVEGEDTNDSILDKLLDRFLDIDNSLGFWEHCNAENCVFSERCYIKYNVDSLRDPKRGPLIRQRLKRLILAVHFRKNRHITMRDLRSILSFVLFNKSPCRELHAEIDNGTPILGRFYYNSVFNNEERDRIAELLSELDVAKVSNPKLDNFINFRHPEDAESQGLYVQPDQLAPADLPHLVALFKDRTEGTQDTDPGRQRNTRTYHSFIRRKLFFEGDESRLKAQGLPIWKDLLPYRQFDPFMKFVTTKADPGGALRNQLTLAISKSERIYNETVGRENLCLRSSGSRRVQTKAFYAFPATDFEIAVADIGGQADYLEYLPNCIYYRPHDKSAALEIPLDLFEVLCRIHDGYVPTASEIQTFFLNLDMFKRRLTCRPAGQIILTSDDTNLYEVKRTTDAKLVMTKLGG